MMKKTRTLAIIPARGGSKRIPRKNLRNFLGRPIISYSIKAALGAQCFDEIMVSTDDLEIARVAKKAGAKVPFLRSAETSTDFATTAQVLEEVLNEYRKLGREFDLVCCLYPTAPLVSAKKMREGCRRLKQTGADELVAVVQYSHPIQRAYKIVNGRLKMISPRNLKVRTQDLPPCYHDAGQFFWFKANSFLNDRRSLLKNKVALLVSETQVQDIDNLDDWKIAELKYRAMKVKERK